MQKKKRTLLWSLYPALEDKQVSYLFGSMHIKDYRIAAWLEFLTTYISQCQTFMAELQLDSVPDNLVLTGRSKESKFDLRIMLGGNKFTKLRKILLKSFDVDIEDFRFLAPLIVINRINDVIFTSLQPLAMDIMLWNEAKRQGRELRGLETWEEQIQYFNQIPVSYQLKALIKLSKNVAGYRSQLLKLLENYEAMDIHALYLKSKHSLGKQRHQMLYKRNAIMADRIFLQINKKPTFFCIGAGHLSGKKGIIHLLKEKNLSVKPVLAIR